MIKPEIMNWITESLRRRRAEAEAESAREREMDRVRRRESEARDKAYAEEERRIQRERIEAEQRSVREGEGFQALRSIHVPEMLEEIKARYWKKGQIVTIKDSMGESYYGIQFVYKSKIWRNFGTYYIDDVEATDIQEKDEQNVFDGIYVGIGTGISQSGHIVRTLSVKSINAGHFNPKESDYYFTMINPSNSSSSDDGYKVSGSSSRRMWWQISSQNELVNLIPNIQNALLDDALERESNGRLPRTVAKVDWRSKSPDYGRLF